MMQELVLWEEELYENRIIKEILKTSHIKKRLEEAKFYRDKHVLETIPILISDNQIDKNTAVIVGGVSPENYEKIKKDKKYSNEEKFLIKNVLEDPNLFARITEEEFDKKIQGELKSRKAIFLSLCSIWIKDREVPLNTLVSSESSAGKSYVCKKIIGIFPESLVEYRSKISAEAFTYWHVNDDEWTWGGKICYLEDISQTVLDSATFKVMCSEGSIATVVRNQKSVDLIVNGMPCMLVTTASTSPSAEIINRFQIAQLDESVEQTIEVTKSQALQEEKQEYDTELVTALTLLKRKNVFIPYAIPIHEFLLKSYGFEDLRMRRDFSRLLDLIRCSCVLHQYQRQVNERGYLVANEQDYEIAREVINYISGTTLKGLTHKLKKAYEACLEEREFSASEVHASHPFVSLTQWYKYIDELSERNLLTQELREQGGYERDGKTIGAKPIRYYKVVTKRVLNLPQFNQLNQFNQSNQNLGIEKIEDEKSGLIGKNGLIGNTKSTNSTNLTEKPILIEKIDFSKSKIKEALDG